MIEKEILHEGRPSKAAAIGVATGVFVVLAGLTVIILLLPDQLRTVQYILGALVGILAVAAYPWQLLDVKRRRHILTSDSLVYRCGIISRYEIEIPYRSMRAVTVRQGIIQRLFRCGDVRVWSVGVSGPTIISSIDKNSLCIRSIPDYAKVSAILREHLTEPGAPSTA
jgi:uncharacterized membrane protein YdbT with pleckstrin-like domain